MLFQGSVRVFQETPHQARVTCYLHGMNEVLVLPVSAGLHSLILQRQDLPMVQVHPDGWHVTDWLVFNYEEDKITWGAVTEGWELVRDGTLWRKPKVAELYELAEEIEFPLSYSQEILDAMGLGSVVHMPYLDHVAVHNAWEGEWNLKVGLKASAAGRLKLHAHPLLEHP